MLNVEEKIIENLVCKNLDLAKKVRDGVGGSSDEAYSFIISCLKDILFESSVFGLEKLKEIIVDGGEDGDIDVFYDDGKTIHVMDIKNSSSLNTKSFETFERALRKYVYNQATEDDLRDLNPGIKRQLNFFYNDIGDKKIRCYVIRNTKNSFTVKDKGVFSKIKSEYKDEFHVELLNRETLLEKLFLTENFNLCWDLNYEEDGLIYQKDGNEYIAKIALLELFNLIKRADKEGSDLFAKNVRNFVGNKGLSEGIIKTIESSPEKFHIFHNGITFSATDVSKKAKNKLTVTHPQIINGCQTVNTIYQYFKDKSETKILNRAYVFCRLFKLEKSSVEKVCEASNTQIKITHSDLRSNDDVQIKLEKLIGSIPDKQYLYERKKQKKTDKPRKVKIRMTELAQWIYSSKFEEPADSKNKKNQLFEISSKTSLYHKIFPIDFDPVDLELICNIGVFVRQQISKTKKKSSRKIMKHANLHILSGMYFLRKVTKGSFDKVFRVISAIITKPPLSKYGDDFNKIFTKEEATWRLIKLRLKK